MNDTFSILDLLHWVWSHIGKYIWITLCTIAVYFLGVLIIGTFIPPSKDLLTGLIVTLVITNCTGYLAGKLNRILRLLEVLEHNE